MSEILVKSPDGSKMIGLNGKPVVEHKFEFVEKV